MSAVPESRRSPDTPRAFLMSLMAHLAETKYIKGYQIGDIALSTVTAHNGERYNITVYRISGEDYKEPVKSPRPMLKRKREGERAAK